MMDMADSATRVWNALWWSQNPFFVLPKSGHPFWFYFMGPLIMITKEIYYTPIFTMIILITVSGFFLFKTAIIIYDYKTAIICLIIFLLNPVVFRLNFEPYSQQIYLTAMCIMVYFFLKAIYSPKSQKYFIISGIFSFISLFTRPEALFPILCFTIYSVIIRKKGWIYFILLSLWFQIFWLILSYIIYGSPFKTFIAADQYTAPLDITGANILIRLKGFFLPYYFLIVGFTFILFCFFMKGLFRSYKELPRKIILVLLIPILIPALVNGAASVKSTIYHTTHYIYLMFFFGSIFTAYGLKTFINRIKSESLQIIIALIIILTCIPLSYMKQFVPDKYNKLFPKAVEFIVTSDEPEDTRALIKIIDANIDEYPSLIFDASQNESSIFYIPFRTKLAPPEKIFINGYNTPSDNDSLILEVQNFTGKNKRGIIILRKENNNFSDNVINAVKDNYKLKMIENPGTDKWIIYKYEQK